jgi:undecaprenyl-diphosphatase
MNANPEDDFPTRTALARTAMLGAFLFLTAAAWILAADRLPFDMPVHSFATQSSDATLDSLARGITHLGDAPVMYTVAAVATLVLLLHRDWLEASVMGLGMLLTIAFVRLGKFALARQRPADDIASAHGHSFPSGHSAYSFAWVAIAVILIRVVPGLRGRRWPIAVAIAIAAIVPLTRVYLRAHWLSDTIAGTGEAMMSFSLVALIALAVARR